jgi:hypothetical protein
VHVVVVLVLLLHHRGRVRVADAAVHGRPA